jgi:hypothetical protein
MINGILLMLRWCYLQALNIKCDHTLNIVGKWVGSVMHWQKSFRAYGRQHITEQNFSFAKGRAFWKAECSL